MRSIIIYVYSLSVIRRWVTQKFQRYWVSFFTMNTILIVHKMYKNVYKQHPIKSNSSSDDENEKHLFF